jgi:hypothetical protein
MNPDDLNHREIGIYSFVRCLCVLLYDATMQFLSSCKMLRSVHIVRNATTASASFAAAAAPLSGKAPSSPALPPADSSLPAAAAASVLLSASYKNRTPFTFGGAASGGLPPSGDFSIGGAMHAKHEALPSVSASATAPAATAATAAAAKMFRSAWSEDEVVTAVKQQVRQDLHSTFN